MVIILVEHVYEVVTRLGAPERALVQFDRASIGYSSGGDFLRARHSLKIGQAVPLLKVGVKSEFGVPPKNSLNKAASSFFSKTKTIGR